MQNLYISFNIFPKNKHTASSSFLLHLTDGNRFLRFFLTLQVFLALEQLKYLTLSNTASISPPSSACILKCVVAVMRMIVLSVLTCSLYLSSFKWTFAQREELFCCFEGCPSWGWAKSLDWFLCLANQVTGVQYKQFLWISTVLLISASSDQYLGKLSYVLSVFNLYLNLYHLKTPQIQERFSCF